MLKSKGGVMPESVGATQVCDAAAKGDVQTLRLLVITWSSVLEYRYI